jgi:protein CpxP
MKRIVLSTVLSLAFSTAAFAQDAPNSTRAIPALHRIEQRLHVTDEQRAQIKTILEQERPTLTQLHTQREAERAEMAQLATFDEAHVRAIAARYAQTETDALVEREKLRSGLFAVLTPAQQLRIQKLRSRLRAAIDARLTTAGDNL